MFFGPQIQIRFNLINSIGTYDGTLKTQWSTYLSKWVGTIIIDCVVEIRVLYLKGKKWDGTLLLRLQSPSVHLSGCLYTLC